MARNSGLRMNPSYLLLDEVEYELLIRGEPISQSQSLEEKQRILRRYLRSELIDETTKIERLGLFETMEELRIVREKFKFLLTVLKDSGTKSNDFMTFETRLFHLHSRVSRLLKEKLEMSLISEVLELRSEISSIFEQFIGKAIFEQTIHLDETFNEEFEDLLNIGDFEKSKINHMNDTNPFRNGQFDQTFSDFGLKKKISQDWSNYLPEKFRCSPERDFVRHFGEVRNVPQQQSDFYPVRKWNIKFSGEEGLLLLDFLTKVNGEAYVAGTSDTELLRSAKHLFTGRAERWYNSARSRFNTWSELVCGLKEAFLPLDNDYYLFRACEDRKQASNESFEMYLVEMEHLFGGLSYLVPEQVKLSIIKRNLRQMYKIPLTLVDVRTVEDLRKFCRKLDATDETLFFANRASQSVNNSRTMQVFKPVESAVQNYPSNNPFTNVGDVGKQFVCFNCGGPNHRSRDCTKKKPIVCFGCGLAGHIRPDCPKFSGNGSARTG